MPDTEYRVNAYSPQGTPMYWVTNSALAASALMDLLLDSGWRKDRLNITRTTTRMTTENVTTGMSYQR